MTKKERAIEVLKRLDEKYTPEVETALVHETPWQLLISTILSAQCTDARVNLVTKDLYKKYTSVKDFAEADQEELEKDIHSCGFYHSKAKNIIACCKKLMADYGGEVPSSLDDLTSLPGVGRKTANVVRGNIFREPSIVVDTHVGRISRRLGFTKETDPKKVEFDLMKLFPKDHWISCNMQIITLGRTICTARNPKCGECFLQDLCPSCTVRKGNGNEREKERK